MKWNLDKWHAGFLEYLAAFLGPVDLTSNNFDADYESYDFNFDDFDFNDFDFNDYYFDDLFLKNFEF